MNLNYEPVTFVPDITVLSEEEWLEKRKFGIGGSDAAKIMGDSVFAGPRELYWDKIGEEDYFDPEKDDFIQKEVGHLLEPLVVKIFEKKNPGWKTYKDNRMVRHPLYPFMLADIDYYTIDPRTGKKYILECKTTSESVLQKEWGTQTSDKCPKAYVWQCRHYMAVHNVDGAILVCLAGNRITGFRQRFIARDYELEDRLIKAEADFWYKVQNRILPEPNMLESILNHYEPKKDTYKITTKKIARFDILESRKKALNRQLKQILDEEEELKTCIFDVLKGNDGIITDEEHVSYRAGTRVSTNESFPSEMLVNLKLEYPEVYKKYVTKKENVSVMLKKTKEVV